MKKYKKGNGHHLTLSDRTYIEQELTQGNNFKSISEFLEKDLSTISKEVKLNRYTPLYSNHPYGKCDRCLHYEECTRVLSSYRSPSGSDQIRSNSAWRCPDYDPHTCAILRRPPYVCNACENRVKCNKIKYMYSAIKAQRSYELRLSESRKGINMTLEELEALNKLISPLILKGQPLSHIFAVHKDEIPVTRRTIYNYLDQRVFQAKNIDLPRRVRYKKRRKRQETHTQNVEQRHRNKRTYVDFEKYTKAFPELDVVEMDTVKGGRYAGKCLLTLLFRSCSFMIIILLPSCTQSSVINAINNLCDTIGIRLFKKYFPIILTDNGPEFKNPWDIERNESGTLRTRVFYCDPYISNQKARLEKNHEYIRYVIPKGRSMYKYTQEDISLMASHINSTSRDSLNGATPFDLANLLIDKRIPILTGQFKVSPDNVLLKPALIEHRD